MTVLRFTPRARLQLMEIWHYSERRWGERRASAYLDAINTAIEQAAAGSRRTRSCTQYGDGLRTLKSGSHNVYLRFDQPANEVLIIGVLHQKMDPARHLTKDEGQ